VYIDALTLSVREIVALIGGWSVLLIGMSTFLSRLFLERQLSRWRRDEQLMLETLRSELSGNRLLLEAAIKSYTSGQDLLQQRRVAAVERLWAGVLQLRERFSAPVFFFGILLPSEYDSVFEKDGPLADTVSKTTEETIQSAIDATTHLESDRPHLGEALWLRFFIYRAFLARLAYLIVSGKKRRHIQDWRSDGGVRQQLGHVLSKDTVESLLRSADDPNSINRAINMLESLLLEEMSLITSGRRSSFESFENAKDLRAAMSAESSAGLWDKDKKGA
jgi:hypothetical protein